LKQSSFTQAVNNNSNSKKRNYLEINQDILKCLDENVGDEEDGLSITGLMYLSKITNSHTFYKKLEPLVGAGHIQQSSLNRYKITDKGKEYLKTLNEVLLPYTVTTKPSNSKSIINKKTYRKRR
jgi:predicted transcriptional regulator